MTEANVFYIHLYNLFITVNQSIDMIMEDLHIDLSYGQYTILKFISVQKENRISQKQLDDWSSLRKPTISQCLKVMVKRGYILHYSMNDDTRCKEIVLTDKALVCIKQIDHKMAEILLQKMTEKDMSFYTQSLKSVKEIIERQGDIYDQKISTLHQRV